MSLWSRIQRQLGEIAGDLLADETHLELEQARALLATDPGAAVELLDKLVAEHPDHALARALLGSAHLELGDPRAAADQFEQALGHDDSLPEALLGRGEAALAMGRPEDAITPYHRAIGEAGGDRRVLAEAYRGLGAAYRRLNKLDKAVRELRKAVAENSDDPLARGMLGEALVARGVYDEARRHLRRAEDAEPIPTLALIGLGKLAQAEGEQGRARAYFEAASEALQPGAFEAEPGEVWLGLGMAALQGDDPEAAREHFQRATEHRRSAAVGLAKLGDLAADEGDIETALDRYRQSLEKDEDDQVLERAVTAAIAKGSAERRSELADRLLAKNPKHPRAMVAKALALAERGDRDAARAVLDQAAGQGGDAHAHLALATLEQGEGQLERAAEHALAALRRSPRHRRARELLAEIRHAQLEAQTGPSDPKHVTEADDAACFQLATSIAELLATRAQLAALAPDAAAAAADFDRPLLVTVMGEFSSGKSSFVNAFIGEDIAPTGITPTTATINVVKYGRQRAGRLHYQDGRTESLDWTQLESRLRELTGRAAAQIAQVEILLPLEELERVHIVDTPGLNSILPEHETVARDFISRADAVVWLFSAAQAGKKTERLALEGIREQGKRVLGVLNKVDQLDEAQIAEVVGHVHSELSDLVDVVVPVSARRAIEAKAAGEQGDAAFAKLEAELESRFFARARELKRVALDRRLRQVVGAARGRLESAKSADQGQSQQLRQAADQVMGDLDRFLGEVVDRERSAMSDAVSELYRSAAREVLDLVRPRRLPFGSHQATPADRDYLIGLLEDGYDTLVGQAEARVSAELEEIGARALAVVTSMSGEGDVSGDLERAGADAGRWVKAQVFGRTGAYVRGYLRGGYVSTFFSRDLPKIELDEETIYQALYHASPDLDAIIALPMAHAVADALSGLADRLEHLADVADLHGFDLDVGIVRALEQADLRRKALMGGDDSSQTHTGD